MNTPLSKIMQCKTGETGKTHKTIETGVADIWREGEQDRVFGSAAKSCQLGSPLLCSKKNRKLFQFQIIIIVR